MNDLPNTEDVRSAIRAYASEPASPAQWSVTDELHRILARCLVRDACDLRLAEVERERQRQAAETRHRQSESLRRQQESKP